MQCEAGAQAARRAAHTYRRKGSPTYILAFNTTRRGEFEPWYKTGSDISVICVKVRFTATACVSGALVCLEGPFAPRAMCCHMCVLLALCAVLWLSCCTTHAQLLQTSRITSILTPVPLLTYKDPHTPSRRSDCLCFIMCAHGSAFGTRAARHTLLRSSACRTSGSLVAAVALVRSARAGFFERAVCLYNAAEKVARRRSTSRAELHHLRAVPDDEVQRRR